jgi:1-aminocyclopropane-1-carboxylate deaminase
MLSPIDITAIKTQVISLPLLDEKGVDLTVLRLDTVHSDISGNKWFKLQYYLEDAKQQDKKTIVTWGGAWSNHIIATAVAAKHHGFKSIGLIRGEKPAQFSPSLIQAIENGMQLHFIDRNKYRMKEFIDEPNFSDHYFINEGGYGEKGMIGASSILLHCRKQDYSHICGAIGTGTMTAGFLNAADKNQIVVGISVLKNNLDAEEKIRQLVPEAVAELQVIHGHHCGGYARSAPELIHFMNEFYRLTGIPSDFVYTGKLFFAINNLIMNDFFKPGSKILVVHSGGLQGNKSLEKGTLIF